MRDNQFEYASAMERLSYTTEQKAELARRVSQAAGTQRKVHRRIPGRAVLVAAALTAALAVTAGASGVLKSAVEVFSPIFGGSAAQTEIIDQIGYPIGASATDNGITITADAILGDAYNAAIVFTISRDDGTALLPEEARGAMLTAPGIGGADLNIQGGCHGSSYFLVDDPAGSSIQMVQTLSSDVPINDCTATAEFDNICRWDEETGESIPVLEGHWKFRFDVQYEDASRTLGSGETFTQDGMTFTINSIQISPVAVKVNYTVDEELQWSQAENGQVSQEETEQERRFENVEILLTLTDGTVLDLAESGFGGSVAPGDGVTVCSRDMVFSQIIPMEDMASISVGGVTFPIPQA